MARIAKYHHGIVVGTNVEDMAMLKDLMRQMSELPLFSGVAIGPATVAAEGVRSAVSAIHSVHLDLPVIYWHTALDSPTHFGVGSPAIEPSVIPVLKEGGVSAVMGFLKADNAEETIALADKAAVKIIFAGQSEDGYFFAVRNGIREFLIGNDVDHLARMGRLLPDDANLWMIPTSSDANVGKDLFRRARSHSISLVMPTKVSDPEFEV